MEQQIPEQLVVVTLRTACAIQDITVQNLFIILSLTKQVQEYVINVGQGNIPVRAPRRV